MSEHAITVPGGTSIRLATAGKYCDRDIVVTATGGSSNDDWFNDGNTHIWISLPEGRTSPMLGVCPNGTVTVDWGDGTTPDTLTGTSTSTVKWTPTHNYAKPGDYVITLTVDGEMGFRPSSTSNEGILQHTSDIDVRNSVYINALRKVEVGNGVTIPNYAFRTYYGITSIAVSNDVTSIGQYAFYMCYNLKSITIPNSVTSLGKCAFMTNYSLVSVTISGGVQSFESQVFTSCGGVRYYDFSNYTTVPTLSNTNAFSGIPSDCEIRVPAALYDQWIAATNWTTYAKYIVAV